MTFTAVTFFKSTHVPDTFLFQKFLREFICKKKHFYENFQFDESQMNLN